MRRKLWESVKRGLETIEKPEEEIATLPEIILIMLFIMVCVIGILAISFFAGALVLTALIS